MRDDLAAPSFSILNYPFSILHLRNSGGIKLSTLYLVAPPIGNLSDLSPRAREVLSTVDFIAAEDTRVTQKLLNACELPKKPMISYYEHNRRSVERIARFDGSWLVPVNYGTTTLTADCCGFTAQCTVTVVRPEEQP